MLIFGEREVGRDIGKNGKSLGKQVKPLLIERWPEQRVICFGLALHIFGVKLENEL